MKGILVTAIYLSSCLPAYLFGYVSIYLSICLSICISAYLFVYLPIYLSICLSICLSNHPSINLSLLRNDSDERHGERRLQGGQAREEPLDTRRRTT